jgi:hypothetical protein
LQALVPQNAKFQWTEVEEDTFQKLKTILVNAPMLTFPDYNEPFVVQTDACDEGLGAVLSQTVNGIERAVEYRSRVLQPAEKPWSVREKEALAIIYACETFRPYLYGTKFTIETDHQSLQWLMKAKSPARLVRWALRLAEFDFDIKYRKGRHNGNADGLSRNPVEELNAIVEIDDVDDVWSLECMLDLICVVREERSAQQSLATLLQSVESSLQKITREQMINAQRNDTNLKDAITRCERGDSDTRNMELIDGMLYLKKTDGKYLLVVPWNLIESVLNMFHNEATAAHLSRDRLYSHLNNRFYWYGMYADVSRWTNSCIKCRSCIPTRPLNHGLLHPIVTTRPMEILGMDILGPFPTTNDGYNYILVCVDLYTSWVEAGLLKTVTAVEVCKLFLSLIVSRHSCPETLLTDQGRQFVSKVFRKLCADFNIKHLESTAYHHQTNGKVERFNKYVEDHLKPLIKPDQRNWDKMLDNVLMSYRMSVNRTTGEKPFFLMYGRDPVLPQDKRVAGIPRNQREVRTTNVNTYKQNLVNTLQATYNQVDHTRAKYQQYYKEYYDKSQHEVKYNKGDQVMLHTPAPKPNQCFKLTAHWHGPYTVNGLINHDTYSLSMTERNRVVNTAAHVQRMMPLPLWVNTRRHKSDADN